jgi:uncharacterized Ntn-hydrolase superfamily protein
MTYSIVARDPQTGQIGVAVQSHYFSVGSSVSWAEAGVGAVATQAVVNADYGPEGIDLMKQGLLPQEALSRLLRQDQQSDLRQVAMVDAAGNVAAHTGSLCMPPAGNLAGDGFSVQGNLLASPGVWPAMKTAFEAAAGELGDRLLAALDAAQSAGGDVRGQQSAALLVVSGEKQARAWEGKLYDLRVDDHSHPLDELRRLLDRRRACVFQVDGDEAMAAGRGEDAMAAYARAWALAPDLVELRFWPAVTLFSFGREAEALEIFRQVFAAEPFWADLIPTLVARKWLRGDVAAIRRVMPGKQ